MALARNAPDALVIAVLWLVVPLVVILGLPFAHELRVRYFLYALPVYLLLTACGLRVAVGWFADRLGRLSASAGPRRTALASAVAATIAVVLVLGLVGLTRMPWDLFPRMDLPYIAVIIPYPGAGPEEIEQRIVRPVEDAVSVIENADVVTGHAQENVGAVVIAFT